MQRAKVSSTLICGIKTDISSATSQLTCCVFKSTSSLRSPNVPVQTSTQASGSRIEKFERRKRNLKTTWLQASLKGFWCRVGVHRVNKHSPLARGPSYCNGSTRHTRDTAFLKDARKTFRAFVFFGEAPKVYSTNRRKIGLDGLLSMASWTGNECGSPTYPSLGTRRRLQIDAIGVRAFFLWVARCEPGDTDAYFSERAAWRQRSEWSALVQR